MAIEQLSDTQFVLSPGVFDVHGHPRLTDFITGHSFDPLNGLGEGKAGAWAYTLEAFESGITRVHFMPNEQRRDVDPDDPTRTIVLPYPISNEDKLQAMRSKAAESAVIPTGQYMGLDPKECIVIRDGREELDEAVLERHFAAAGDSFGLKVYGDVTTGGFNIPVHFIPRIVRLWHKYQEGKPAILHLENENVEGVLRNVKELEEGKHIALHIAHVSSQEELEAVMEAKAAGMNVTCEVTPHHLFLDASARDVVGGDAWMKPTLKERSDVAFLWKHLDSIDMIASDCAPHRPSDKAAEKPAFGVTNYREMLPLLLGAVQEGKLTMDRLYQMLCVAPRKRFGVPVEDGSYVHIATDTEVAAVELAQQSRLQNDPFVALQRRGARLPHMVGRVVAAQAGFSRINAETGERTIRTSYTHATTPRTIGGIISHHYVNAFAA